MGIKNLLKNLKTYKIKINLINFKNQKIGIDALCWLHKSLFT